MNRPRDPPRESLAQPGQAFRLFVEAVKDCAIFMLDPAGNVATWNQGAERIKGFRAAEVIGHHMSDFYTPEDAELGLPRNLLKTAEMEGRVENEGWRVRADGSRFWANVVITAVRDEHGSLQGFGNVIRDLTERKQAEEALGRLTGRLVRAQDLERKRISDSLNDSTSPSFVALLVKLHQLKKRADRAPSQLTDDCIALAQFLYGEIRTQSYLTHPFSLETKGLLAILRAYLEGLSEQKGISVVMDFPAQLQGLSRSAEIALYRFVQEVLPKLLHVSGNLHSKASLMVNDGHLTLRVGDEGHGLSPEALAGC